MSIEGHARQPSRIRDAVLGVNIRRRLLRRRASGRITDYADASDEALVQALDTRDARALETLFDRYGDLVYSVCMRMVNDSQLAEDLSQEVFLRLWRRPELFDAQKGKFSTWLASIARHRSIDENRSRGRRFRYESPPSLSNADALSGASTGEDVTAVYSNDKVIVEKALAALPAEQRLVIDLAYFGGYTQQEIAAGLHLPLGTVKTRIRLGMQKLRLLLIDLNSGGPN